MWYCASILRVAERDGKQDDDSLWEAQFILIKATDKDSAYREAMGHANRPVTPYKNKAGEIVFWRFVKIERIYEIGDDRLTSGTEVFSRFLRNSEARSLMVPFGDDEHS